MPRERESMVAEGLNPIEIGRELHKRTDEKNDERGESPETEEAARGRGTDARPSRRLQICEAALLALVTVTAAWADMRRRAGTQHHEPT
jgi:hypothetical protein